MKGCPCGHPIYTLAAAAATIAAAVMIVSAAHAVVAAAAEQDQQNNDPPDVTAAEVVIAHNEYLRKFFSDLGRSFQDIPEHKKGANTGSCKAAGFVFFLTPTDCRGIYPRLS